MACTITLSTILGWTTDHGIILELMGTCLARKTITVVSTVNDIRAAVADFGKEVHAANPEASFYVSVSIAKGSRKPNGYDAANNAKALRQQTYMKPEETRPCPART